MSVARGRVAAGRLTRGRLTRGRLAGASLGAGGEAPADPDAALRASLFGASERGTMSSVKSAYLSGRLWQDAAGTVAVTDDGDPVGRIDDPTGNNLTLTQTLAADRPVFKTTGGLYWIESNGINHSLVSGDFAPIFKPNSGFALVALNHFDTAIDNFMTEIAVVGGVTSFADGVINCIADRNGNADARICTIANIKAGESLIFLNISPELGSSQDSYHEINVGADYLLAGYRHDGVSGSVDISAHTAWDSTLNRLLLAGNPDLGISFPGRIYGWIWRDTTATSSQQTAARAWAAQIAGIS